MSFSQEVKEELLQQHTKSRHCRLAELSGLLLTEGMISFDPPALFLHGDHPTAQRRLAVLLRSAFGVGSEEEMTAEQIGRICGELYLTEPDGTFPLGSLAGRCCRGELLQRSCCRRSFIRGAFLSSGSLSDPEHSYHFEIVCKNKEQAEQIQKILLEFIDDVRTAMRRQYSIVYLKEGGQIADALSLMGADVCRLNLENLRILRQMRGSVNRRVNCETANIEKTVNAAFRQTEDAEKIRRTRGLSSLSPALRETAELRMENPQASLSELAARFDPPIGRSALNHRLRRLHEIAEQIEAEE